MEEATYLSHKSDDRKDIARDVLFFLANQCIVLPRKYIKVFKGVLCIEVVENQITLRHCTLQVSDHFGFEQSADTPPTFKQRYFLYDKFC